MEVAAHDGAVVAAGHLASERREVCPRSARRTLNHVDARRNSRSIDRWDAGQHADAVHGRVRHERLEDVAVDLRDATAAAVSVRHERQDPHASTGSLFHRESTEVGSEETIPHTGTADRQVRRQDTAPPRLVREPEGLPDDGDPARLCERFACHSDDVEARREPADVQREVCRLARPERPLHRGAHAPPHGVVHLGHDVLRDVCADLDGLPSPLPGWGTACRRSPLRWPARLRRPWAAPAGRRRHGRPGGRRRRRSRPRTPR